MWATLKNIPYSLSELNVQYIIIFSDNRIKIELRVSIYNERMHRLPASGLYIWPQIDTEGCIE